MTDPRDPHPLGFWADMPLWDKAVAVAVVALAVTFAVLAAALLARGIPPARRLDADCVAKEIERVHSVCAIHEEKVP